MQATVRSFSSETRAGTVFLDDGTVVPFDADALWQSGLRVLRFGQRVAVDLVDDGGTVAVRSIGLLASNPHSAG